LELFQKKNLGFKFGWHFSQDPLPLQFQKETELYYMSKEKKKVIAGNTTNNPMKKPLWQTPYKKM
jgi:hypothetical protein